SSLRSLKDFLEYLRRLDLDTAGVGAGGGRRLCGVGWTGRGRKGRGSGFDGRGRFIISGLNLAERRVEGGALVEPGAIALEGPHAVFEAGFQRGNDFEEVAVANEILDGQGGQQHFAFGHAEVPVGAELEALGNDAD